jgi:predicted Rossmann fold flavoprotein
LTEARHVSLLVAVENEAWETVVVGAGAAGIVAALRAAERGRRVLLLEKNAKPGVKILMSGGTRCNLTHDCDNRGIITAYREQGKFLHSALAAFSVAQTLKLFHDEGLATKVEETGKVFPASDRALDVLEALLARLRRSGAVLALREATSEIARTEGGFRVSTERRSIFAEKLILTTGGQSYPGCGTTGDGYRWLAAWGHQIVTPQPALTPITTNAEWAKSLSGVTISDVGLRVLDPAEKNRELMRARGSFLFTHFGFSGPVALDVSRAISAHARPGSLLLECDFLPAISASELAEEIKQRSVAAGRKLLPAILPPELPQRLHEAVCAQSQIRLDRKAAELTKLERAALVSAYKQLPIAVSGTRGFKQAEVTAGGVSLEEVDSRSMQSKLIPHLYLAGEILDLDGPIGGYNFQAAWSTGWLAGSSV